MDTQAQWYQFSQESQPIHPTIISVAMLAGPFLSLHIEHILSSSSNYCALASPATIATPLAALGVGKSEDILISKAYFNLECAALGVSTADLFPPV